MNYEADPKLARSIAKPTDVAQKSFLKSALGFRPFAPFGFQAIRPIQASAHSDHSGYLNDLAKYEYNVFLSQCSGAGAK